MCLYTIHIEPITAPEHSTFPRAESHNSFQAAFQPHVHLFTTRREPTLSALTTTNMLYNKAKYLRGDKAVLPRKPFNATGSADSWVYKTQTEPQGPWLTRGGPVWAPLRSTVYFRLSPQGASPGPFTFCYRRSGGLQVLGPQKQGGSSPMRPRPTPSWPGTISSRMIFHVKTGLYSMGDGLTSVAIKSVSLVHLLVTLKH